MKKVMILVLTLTMLFSITGCGKMVEINIVDKPDDEIVDTPIVNEPIVDTPDVQPEVPTDVPEDKPDAPIEVPEKQEGPTMIDIPTVNDNQTSVWNTTTSETNPADWGEFVRVEDYNPSYEFNDGYQYLGVRVDNIYYGEEANAIAKDYLESESSYYIYEEPTDDIEYLVIDLTIDYSEWLIPEYGETVDFNDIDIFTVGEYFLYEKDKDSYLSMNMSVNTSNFENEVLPGDRYGTCRIITTTLKDCLDPVIEFGSYSTEKGYVKYYK